MQRNRPENVVPQPFGKLFASYEHFNEMQNTLLDDLLNSDRSLVLSAPTGSGKTVAFELAIVRMLRNQTLQQQEQQNFNILPKAIYIAPIKALCSEKFADWKPRFESVGVVCTQLTGDTAETSNLAAIRQAQVVISTPEKWDSLTRRWRDFEQLLPAVQLFIVDEVHLLNEDTRGPVLEAVIARMKSSGVKRFIVASATIPNVEDLSNWIRGGGNNRTQVVQHVFNEMQRPVPLEKHVIGYNFKLKGFQFDMRLNYQLPDILRKYAENKACLVFCNSRKSAEMAAFHLNKMPSIFSLSENQKLYLSQLIPSILDVKLRKLVESGIAYHHAGLHYGDRSLIESSFRKGFLMVLISTSTLAMGINLPARLVVIKSTETYNCGGFTEYAENMVLQMIGRAGRPQYDTKGVAVIMTQQKNVQKYQQIFNGTAPIESHLHKHLTEHLNSEIALKTITSLEMAMVWMRSTYLYIRAVRNPKYYGYDAKLTKDFVEQKLEQLCLRQISALQGAGLVKFDPSMGTDVETTVYGQLMSKYYLCYETMKLFQEIHGKETLEDLLKLLTRCKEMNEFALRVNDKKVLNVLNKTPIRFPIKGRIKNNEDKILCIMQAVLGSIEICAPGLLQESLKIMRISDRISKCLLEFIRLRVKEVVENEPTQNNWYGAILNALTIAKCFHVKLWENSEFATKQLRGIGTVYASTLNKHGITSLRSMANTEARSLERLLNKSAPFGDEVLKHLMSFPQYELKLRRKTAFFVQIHAQQVNQEFMCKHEGSAVLIIGDSLNNLLLLEENLNGIIYEYGVYDRLVRIEQIEQIEQIYAHIIHLSLVGVDAYATLEINNAQANNVVVGANKTNMPKAKKQSRLNFSLLETLFDETVNSNESLNLDDILGSGIEHFNEQKKLSSEKNAISESVMKHSANMTDQSNKFAKFDETNSDLENYRLNKRKMKSTISDSREKIFAKESVNETFNETLNTQNKSFAKQCKLTDFFKKSKKCAAQQQTRKVDENIDLSIAESTFKSPSCLKRKTISFENEQQRNDLTEAQITTRLTETLLTSPIQDLQQKNLDTSKGSTNSSSDDIALTIIPKPKKLKFLNTTSNSSNDSKNTFQQSLIEQRGPLTLESFLIDHNEPENSEPMIKLPKDLLLETNTFERSFLNDSNIFERNNKALQPNHFTGSMNFDPLTSIQNILKTNNKSLNRSSSKQTDFVKANSTMFGFEDNEKLFLEFKGPTFEDFEPSSEKTRKAANQRKSHLEFIEFPTVNATKNDYEIFSNKRTRKAMDNVERKKQSSKSIFKSIGTADKITGNYERKSFNESIKSENSFQKLLNDESLLKSCDYSDSPKTQDSPLDLSKTAIRSKIMKLMQTKSSISTENKATQTNSEIEAQNQTHNDNDLKLWHKVALKLRNLPLDQAQSFTKFRAVYNVVRQQQMLKQQMFTKTTTNLKPQAVPGNAQTQNLFSNHNSSNLKVRNNSTFRLQLFNDDEEKNSTEPHSKLNRRQIKLINQNVMNLVLEKKCEENTELAAEEMALIEEVEREYGIQSSNEFNWNL